MREILPLQSIQIIKQEQPFQAQARQQCAGFDFGPLWGRKANTGVLLPTVAIAVTTFPTGKSAIVLSSRLFRRQLFQRPPQRDGIDAEQGGGPGAGFIAGVDHPPGMIQLVG
jgi:hypothetical protein